MIDKAKLRAAWISKGKTQEDAARVIGVSPKTMSLRMKKGVFGSDEIEALIKEFDISNPCEIFFAPSVTSKVTEAT